MDPQIKAIIQKYLEEMQELQENLLNYLDEDKNLKDLLDEINIQDNQQKLRLFLYLLSKISNDHYHKPDFFNKIEQILQHFKTDMMSSFTNIELFHIFKENKRILLFLFDEKIMIFDQYIVKKITSDKYIRLKYHVYFMPEIKPFMTEKWFPKLTKYRNRWTMDIKSKLPDDFYEKRKIGENDDIICQMIKNDKKDDFIIFRNKSNFPLEMEIEQSIYETNNFIINKYPTLIEYAAFCGSIDIFQYLIFNKVKLTQSLYMYAIHGRNAEIIQILEDNNIKPSKEHLVESIKCHHNEIAQYIQEFNYNDDYSNDILINCLKFYNFYFNLNDLINESSFYYICKYDHFVLVDIFSKKIDVDINKEIILYNSIF